MYTPWFWLFENQTMSLVIMSYLKNMFNAIHCWCRQIISSTNLGPPIKKSILTSEHMYSSLTVCMILLHFELYLMFLWIAWRINLGLYLTNLFWFRSLSIWNVENNYFQSRFPQLVTYKLNNRPSHIISQIPQSGFCHTRSEIVSRTILKDGSNKNKSSDDTGYGEIPTFLTDYNDLLLFWFYVSCNKASLCLFQCTLCVKTITWYFPVRVMSQPCVPIKQN